jgi:two-component system phosphate regulon sensor histidine kinase PhoR
MAAHQQQQDVQKPAQAHMVTSSDSDGKGLRGRQFSSRLRERGWLLAAAFAAMLVLHLAGGGSLLVLVAAVLVFLAVAMVVPVRKAELGAAARAAPGSNSGFTAESLAAAVADPLIVFDQRGVVVLANPAALGAFGDVDPGISLPLKFRTPEMQQLIGRALETGERAVSAEYSERVPIERNYLVSCTAIGGAGLFVMVFKDQSESRRIDRMRADFIANASHELRTPLASIAGFIETLRGPAKDDAGAREQFLQIMQNQTSRMARLINDLLSLSRLEMRALRMGGAKVDLRTVIDSVVNSLQPLASDSGVEIENRIGEARIEVAGDRDELYQVFENLIENACKYGRSGGKVVISAASKKIGPAEEISVEVRDFGPGIAEEHIPRVTERFYRIDGNGSQKGTGLGLAIVKHIVTRHRGRLVISSSLGEGSAFTVHLPAE